MDTQYISETPLPGGYQFEIYASEMDLIELQSKFNNLKQTSQDALKYIGTPFDEWGVNEERETYQNELMSIYSLLYNLGTEKTKQNMIETGILKEVYR